MRQILFALSLIGFSVPAMAADYSGLLECLTGLEQFPRALPLIFNVNPARDGLPAGAYVYETDRAYFCTLPKMPTVFDPKGNFRGWNLNLNVNGVMHPFSTSTGTIDSGSTSQRLLTHTGTPNVKPQVKCEATDLPRMTKALEAHIIEIVQSFKNSRLSDENLKNSGKDDRPNPIRREFLKISEAL